MAAPETFVVSNDPEPHRIRTKEIFKKHPEVKELIGQKSPSTFFITLFCVISQVAIAYLLKDQAWWLILLVAYFVGAFFSHTLFVCIHEAAHDLLFKPKWMNAFTAIIANFPSILPTAVTFKNFHLKHHAFQGVHEMDADMPDYWESKLLRNYSIGKMIFLLFFPVFQIIRTWRCRHAVKIDFWVIMNVIIQFTFDFLIIYYMGWYALLYMALSFSFSIGLHPLGARWAQEHYLTFQEERGKQETFSYYGPLNFFNLNVGYHNEHHDFPNVPWHQLPTVKKIAPEYYDTLKSHTSFVKLFFQFLFDQEISMFSRVIRKNRGGVPESDQSTPDVDLVTGK